MHFFELKGNQLNLAKYFCNKILGLKKIRVLITGVTDGGKGGICFPDVGPF